MLFGLINIFTGIVYAACAAPIALLLMVALIPAAAIIGAIREVKELFTTYPGDCVRMLQHGFKVSNTGLKRVRESRTKPTTTAPKGEGGL